MLLLNDEEWAKWSNREIARRCCVDSTLVDRLKHDISLRLNRSETTAKTYTNEHGQTATMNTENIGRRGLSLRCIATIEGSELRSSRPALLPPLPLPEASQQRRAGMQQRPQPRQDPVIQREYEHSRRTLGPRRLKLAYP